MSGPESGGQLSSFFLRWAIRKAGGRPVSLKPSMKQDIRKLQGVVLSGGADVDPKLYGKEKDTLLYEKEKHSRNVITLIKFPFSLIYNRVLGVGSMGIETGRDIMEMKLLEEALRRKIPVLGICRGMQMINVFLGGSLFHDIRGLNLELDHDRTLFPRKLIILKTGSFIHKIFGTTRLWVNSLHDQGIERLGNGLKINARDENMLVQGIELRDHPFCLGIQWHPEFIPHKPQQLKTFQAFMDFTKELAGRK